METRANHVLIGAFTLAVVAIAFLFILWISKVSLDREWNYYDVIFKEAVTGLSVGSAVQYNGIQVGEVRKLSLAPDDPRQVIARVRVNIDTPVKTDTRAKLNFSGITGVAVIQFSGGSPEASPLVAEEKQTVPRIVAEASALQKLLASSEDIVTSTNDVLLRVGALLSEKNIDRVSHTLEHIDQITETLADQRQDFRKILDDFSAAASQLKTTLVKLDKLTISTDKLVSQDVRAALESIGSTFESTKKLANSAHQILENNRDDINNFSQQGLAQMAAAMNELRETLQTIRSIADRLHYDPAGYLLGSEQVKEFEPAKPVVKSKN